MGPVTCSQTERLMPPWLGLKSLAFHSKPVADAGRAVGVFGVGGAEGALAVVAGVVDLDGEDVLLAGGREGVGDVDAVGGDSVLVEADRIAVEEDVAGLAHSLELEEDAMAGGQGGEPEVLAIPGEALVGAAVAAAVGDELAEAVDVVEAVRRGDGGPFGVVEGGRRCVAGDLLQNQLALLRVPAIAADELPVEVEVERGARGAGRRVGGGGRGGGRGKGGVGAAQNDRKTQGDEAGCADKFAAGYFSG